MCGGANVQNDSRLNSTQTTGGVALAMAILLYYANFKCGRWFRLFRTIKKKKKKGEEAGLSRAGPNAQTIFSAILEAGIRRS